MVACHALLNGYKCSGLPCEVCHQLWTDRKGFHLEQQKEPHFFSIFYSIAIN
jgi:hypothetical protein